MRKEKRREKRFKYGYYMRVTDNNTHEILGYLSEISLRGFKLEGPKILTVKKDYALRLEYTSEVIDKPYIVFIARVMWSQPDLIIPNEYIQGLRIISISPSEQEIYQSIVEKYGPPKHKW
ncbi:MAG: PilZ domain-containing protein [Anaerolineales bacterium]|jgi:hypothetical protein